MAEWRPLRGLTGSLRQQLEAQVQDNREFASTADDLASLGKTYQPSLAEALATAFTVKGAGDAYFQRDLDQHD